MSFEHVKNPCFFNNNDKTVINFIKNLCTSHMLLKKMTHVNFMDQVEGNSFNPVCKETLSYIYIYIYIYSSFVL
jgi:endonuclease III-like uncharacterized protein